MLVLLGTQSDQTVVPSIKNRELWQFRLMHVIGFFLIFPVVIGSRVRGHAFETEHESVFGETDRLVLTALGMAFMA